MLRSKNNNIIGADLDWCGNCYEFRDEAEANEWGRNVFGEWSSIYKHQMRVSNPIRGSSKFPIDGTMPIEKYCGNSYRDINRYLRGELNRALTPNESAVISSLWFHIHTAPRLDRNLISYRIVNRFVYNRIIECGETHSGFQEMGFMSTCLVMDKCLKNCMPHNVKDYWLLRLHIKQDTPAIYVNEICKRDETELLLKPNLYYKMIKENKGIRYKGSRIQFMDVSIQSILTDYDER